MFCTLTDAYCWMFAGTAGTGFKSDIHTASCVSKALPKAARMRIRSTIYEQLQCVSQCTFQVIWLITLVLYSWSAVNSMRRM